MPQPNIIFMHVDEMRYPMHLPNDTPTPETFLAKYMPNLYSLLWTKGVKFKRYFNAQVLKASKLKRSFVHTESHKAGSRTNRHL
jgi:hypothetical protein